jgi:transcriptional regulator with XRE-family HTH domain
MEREHYYRLAVGQLLRLYRDNLPTSQNRLAAMTGVSRATLVDAEKGHKSLRLDSLTRIVDVLEISWEEFGKLLDAAMLKCDEKAFLVLPEEAQKSAVKNFATEVFYTLR